MTSASVSTSTSTSTSPTMSLTFFCRSLRWQLEALIEFWFDMFWDKTRSLVQNISLRSFSKVPKTFFWFEKIKEISRFEKPPRRGSSSSSLSLSSSSSLSLLSSSRVLSFLVSLLPLWLSPLPLLLPSPLPLLSALSSTLATVDKFYFRQEEWKQVTAVFHQRKKGSEQGRESDKSVNGTLFL